MSEIFRPVAWFLARLLFSAIGWWFPSIDYVQVITGDIHGLAIITRDIKRQFDCTVITGIKAGAFLGSNDVKNEYITASGERSPYYS